MSERGYELLSRTKTCEKAEPNIVQTLKYRSTKEKYNVIIKAGSGVIDKKRATLHEISHEKMSAPSLLL